MAPIMRDDGTVSLVHSVPAAPRPEPCVAVVARPARALRGYVAGYSCFASGDGAAVGHRGLAFALTTLVVDTTGHARVVTGPSAAPVRHDGVVWAAGVTVGLTPAGVRALLGVPVTELAGAVLPLADVLGGRDAELAERLHAAPGAAERFAVLDAMLAGRSAGAPGPDPLVAAAWAALHRPDRPRVGALAERLGVSRRHLEVRFRSATGLSPGAAGRIARFQRAVGRLAAGWSPARAAAECGYADQPHLQRDVRALAGVTPAALCALLQYTGPAAA